MGVKGAGGLPGPFERRHVGLSFRRSAVLMTWGTIVSRFHVSPVWMAGAYVLAFVAGLDAGRRVQGGRGRMLDRGLARCMASEDVRPGLVFLAVLALVVFAATVLKTFTVWFEEVGDPAITFEGGLVLLQSAFRGASELTNPAFVVCAALGPVSAIVCGWMDGFWTGAVRSRRGVKFREVVPFGVGWWGWRLEESCRRRRYLQGGFGEAER